MQPTTSKARELMVEAFIKYKQSIGKTKEQAEAEFNQFAIGGAAKAEDHWNVVVQKYADKERDISEEAYYQHALKKVGARKMGEPDLTEEDIAKINDIFGGEPITA